MLYLPDDWTAMRQALHTWVQTVLGPEWTVIWSQQAAPSPPFPYATLTLLTLPEKLGQPSARLVDTGATIEEHVTYDAELTLSVQLFGGGDSWVYVTNLEASSKRADIRELLDAAGWAPRSVVGRQFLDRVMGADWEPRTVLDRRLGCVVRVRRPGADFIDPQTILATLTAADGVIVGELGA